MKTREGGAALVTGASAGIGAEFARQLAAAGVRPVLVARRAEKLGAVAEAIRSRYGIDCEIITADLSDPSAAAQIRTECDHRDIHPDWLINNAGAGMPGKFLSVQWPGHEAYAQLMMLQPLALIHSFLPGMRERGFGRIVNVASLAGLIPSAAGHTLYGGTKAFLIRVSEALNAEYSSRGVHVCASCPGFTYSEFHDVAGTRAQVSRMPSFMWQESGPVVAASLHAVEAGRSVVVTGRVNKLLSGLLGALPHRIASRIVNSRSHQFRRTD